MHTLDVLPELDRDALFARLADAAVAGERKIVVLCSSTRLAQHLQETYARWQATHGVAAWPTATLLTPEIFLERLAERWRQQRRLAGEPQPAPLSEAESELLWRLVVSEVRVGEPLLHEAEAAQLAAEAWRLCQDYRVAVPLPVGTSEVERFNAWCAAYRARCARLNRPDAGVARADACARIVAGALPVPQSAVLAGFDAREPVPWMSGLWQALRDSGCALQRLAEPARTARVVAAVADSAEQELRAAAVWVRERAQRAPQARIGVVVPDLHARRADLMRVFDQELSPLHDTLDAGRAARPYNLSLGAPLAQEGLVQCALQLLRLCVEGLDLPAAGSLLCSPYWGGGERERLHRAELDRGLRADGHLQVDLGVLQRLVRRHEGLQSRLAQLAQLARRDARSRADLADWADRFSAWLAAAGWPGPRSPDSREYQALQAWRALLPALASLGEVLGPVPASAALMQLQTLAGRRVFQPQTPPVNIQVLGALEAQGLAFDALWVLGLDDERWPPGGRPNPFIPFELQRRLGMPHASTAQELAWAERTTARWRRAAPEVVFSWPVATPDRPLAPSPLIQPEATRAQPLAADTLAPAWRAARACADEERVADAYGPRPDLTQPVPGGARLLGDQARCPFRAFATHRLGAKALEQPGYGPNAIDRGELVHRALEALWRQWRDQATLLALDEAALDAAVGTAVDAGLDRLAREAPQRLPSGLRRLESQRLRELLRDWLQIERERPPFVVERLEGSPPESAVGAGVEEQVRHFGELRLRLRPDRVDRLADGRRLVLDYKTGARKPAPWLDGRPEEPQLLLYALTQLDVAGVAYARLRAGGTGFDGIAAAEGLAPELKAYTAYKPTRDAANWDALMGRWRGELDTLADEVCRGLASVTPRHPRQSCSDCHLHALCRIHEAQPLAAQLAEDET